MFNLIANDRYGVWTETEPWLLLLRKKLIRGIEILIANPNICKYDIREYIWRNLWNFAIKLSTNHRYVIEMWHFVNWSKIIIGKHVSTKSRALTITHWLSIIYKIMICVVCLSNFRTLFFLWKYSTNVCCRYPENVEYFHKFHILKYTKLAKRTGLTRHQQLARLTCFLWGKSCLT